MGKKIFTTHIAEGKLKEEREEIRERKKEKYKDICGIVSGIFEVRTSNICIGHRRSHLEDTLYVFGWPSESPSTATNTPSPSQPDPSLDQMDRTCGTRPSGLW
ncbi:hypothetical protein Dimus_039352 [Dionaea muscipula]